MFKIERSKKFPIEGLDYSNQGYTFSVEAESYEEASKIADEIERKEIEKLKKFYAITPEIQEMAHRLKIQKSMLDDLKSLVGPQRYDAIKNKYIVTV